MSGGSWKDMFKGVEKNDLELVKYHIKTGIDPNYQHPEYLTGPLFECIRLNHLEIAKFLLDNGIDPTQKEGFGSETPLSLAEKHNNQAFIELIKSYIKD